MYDIGKVRVFTISETKYKYDIGVKILSPNIGGVCTLHNVQVL